MDWFNNMEWFTKTDALCIAITVVGAFLYIIVEMIVKIVKDDKRKRVFFNLEERFSKKKKPGSRAKQAALKLYPVLFSERIGRDHTMEVRRVACEHGYMAAEEDIRPLIDAARKVFESWKAGEGWMLYHAIKELDNILKRYE